MFYYHSRVNLWMVFFYKSIIIIKLIYKIIVKFFWFFPLIGVIFGIENKKKKGMY